MVGWSEGGRERLRPGSWAAIALALFLALMGGLVVASGASAQAATSATAAAASSPTAGTYTALTPLRLLDTRSGVGGTTGKIASGGTVKFAVAGKVPTNDRAGAAVLNVTVTGATASGYVTAYPTGTSRPATSNVNFVAGGSIAGAVTVQLGADGTVTLYNGSTQPVHLLADITGWYASGTTTTAGGFNSVAPARILDTRSGNGASTGLVPAGGSVELQVTGRGNVPASAGSVVLNVSVTGATAGGYITTYPTGETRPGTSTVNYVAGRSIANAATVKVGSGGKVTLYNGSTKPVHIIADVSGYFVSGTVTAAGTFTGQTPARILDTRNGTGTGGQAVTVAAGGSIDLTVSTSAAAAILNVTATRTSASGYIQVYPKGATRPDSSSVNFVAGQSIPNQVTAQLGTGGKVTLYNGSTRPISIVADLLGTYSASTALSPAVSYKITENATAYGVTVTGRGFDPAAPGDNGGAAGTGVYAGVSANDTLPPVEDREEGTEYFVGVNWAMPSSFSNGTFTVGFVVQKSALSAGETYFLYTWQAHYHTTTSQDTRTPITFP